MAFVIEILLVMLLFVGRITSYSSGAPRAACKTLTPRHPGGSIQNSPSPYEIFLSPGQGRVQLTLGSSQGLVYQGFMLVATDIDTGNYVGEFVVLPDDSKIATDCVEGSKATVVTHTSKAEKRSLKFEWEPPADYIGTIIFNSTFAQDYATYWVGVESPRVDVQKRSISISKASPTPAPGLRTTTPPVYNPPVEDATPVAQDPFYDGCKITKNCFGTPDGCIEKKTCKAAVSVLVRGERYLFEVYARQSAYVAVGLSTDGKMGDDSVVECVNDGNQIGLFMSWNTGRSNARHPTPQGAIKLNSSSANGDTLSCKFWREKLTTVQGREYNLVDTPYHLLVAAGSQARRDGVGFHDVAFAGSGEPKLLSDIGGFEVASDILIRVHGAMMLAAWIGTASVGILLARYYKQTWVNSQLCGKDQWFAWHRFFMIITWSLTVASFVIIFVEVRNWSSETAHASFGLATTILCFIQPFMAAFRPHPGTPSRTVFNWSHWFVGNAAHICGIIAIFLAVQATKANLPPWVTFVLVGYVVVHVLSHLILTFAGCSSDRQASHRVNSFPMKDMHSRSAMSHSDARRDAPQSGLRKTIFGLYFLIIVAFTVVLIVFVVGAPIEETWATWMGKVSKI